MEIAPMTYARYRSDAGEPWDTRNYEDDEVSFTFEGVTYTRTVTTQGAYRSAAAAAAELDRLEARVVEDAEPAHSEAAWDRYWQAGGH